LKAIAANRIAPGRLAMPAFPLPIRTSRYRKSLTEAGCEKEIFTEHVSGAAIDRPALFEAMKSVHEGDTRVVWKLDRLARWLVGS
jgi:DNA invertase Pin-like site-specific DNA recombinase